MFESKSGAGCSLSNQEIERCHRRLHRKQRKGRTWTKGYEHQTNEARFPVEVNERCVSICFCTPHPLPTHACQLPRTATLTPRLCRECALSTPYACSGHAYYVRVLCTVLMPCLTEPRRRRDASAQKLRPILPVLLRDVTHWTDCSASPSSVSPS